MAKYEDRLFCNVRDLATYLNEYIVSSSISANLEDESIFLIDDMKCVTRVYERYSWLGGNRLSLTLTLFGRDGDVRLTAITAGGSQAMFFKINTFGEAAFLEKLIDGVEKFKQQRRY